MQYMIGLQRLGIDSFWIDYLDAIDPFTYPHSLDYLMARFRHTAEQFGFGDRYCVVYNNGERHFGLDERQLDRLATEADLLLSISGRRPPDPRLARIPRRAYVDVDPGFTQIWALEWDTLLSGHTFFFTTGQNVGGKGCKSPNGSVKWTPILPPVVLELWPSHIDDRCRSFSTVADWRGSQQATLEGENYGGKREEFLTLIRLPRLVQQRIELALCIGQGDHADLGLLHGNGWRVLDSYSSAGDPLSYREFIRYSRGEVSVAKSGYVKSGSGWVSDRTACYLASGKPAVVQSTGFEDRLPTGKGLLTFRTIEEAAAAIERVNGDYLPHCHAARALAEQYFDSDAVLSGVLEKVGL